METKNEKTVVIISRAQGVVVKGLMRKLDDNAFNVVFTGDDTNGLLEVEQSADIFVIYLDDDIAVLRDAIDMVYDITKNSDKGAVVIGEKRDHEALASVQPFLHPMRSLERPVDPDEFLKVIGQYYYDQVMQKVKKNILVLDDDPLYAKMVRGWLKDDYKVAVSTSPMQAINYLAAHTVDLILLDYEMPVFSGPQVLEMLREDENTAGIPVVFLTGVGSRESVERVMALKPEGYMLKTTTKLQLLNWLADFFEGKKDRPESQGGL